MHLHGKGEEGSEDSKTVFGSVTLSNLDSGRSSWSRMSNKCALWENKMIKRGSLCSHFWFLLRFVYIQRPSSHQRSYHGKFLNSNFHLLPIFLLPLLQKLLSKKKKFPVKDIYFIIFNFIFLLFRFLLLHPHILCTFVFHLHLI